MENYNLLTAITHFGMYFGLALVSLIVFKFLYTLVTPQNEWKLIKENKNTAAAIGLSGAILGFALALAGAASSSVSLIDFATWSGVALAAQLVAFFIVRIFFMPKIVQRIVDNEVSAGIMLASTNIAVGLLNAACMSY
jgi:putative membrane protein